MKIYLTNEQPVHHLYEEVEDFPGAPWIVRADTETDYGVSSYEYTWSVDYSPYVVPDDSMELCKTLSLTQELRKAKQGSGVIYVRIGAQENFQRPTVYISVDDDEGVLECILNFLEMDSKNLSMDVTMSFGPGTTMICFKGLTHETKENSLLAPSDIFLFNFTDSKGTQVSCENAWKCLNFTKHDARFSIVLNIPDNYSSGDDDHCCYNLREQGRKMWIDGLHTDMSVMCLNGEEFPCHKSFLIANSTVVAAELQGVYFEEGLSSTIQMDYESAVVKELLQYCYCRELDLAKSSFQIAVKMLEAAHYYNILPLWKDIVSQLQLMKLNAANVNDCLELFHFLVLVKDQFTEGQSGILFVMKRILYILAQREDDLEQSRFFSTYNEDRNFRMVWIEISLLTMADSV